MMSKRERKQIIKTAMELGYPQATIEKLENALSSIEAQNIMVDARRKETRIWNQ